VWLSEKLTGISKGEFDSHISVNKMLINAESTFEAIQGSQIDWRPHDDSINPYGDRRGIGSTRCGHLTSTMICWCSTKRIRTGGFLLMSFVSDLSPLRISSLMNLRPFLR